jgi:hypothetical protein
MPNVTELGRTSFEDRNLAAAGAMSLADETGGFSIRNTNDLAAGAERVAAESRVFYLLGFEAPKGKKPGDWRKLRVQVKRDGLSVRARRGYTVRAEGAPPAKSVPTKEGTTPILSDQVVPPSSRDAKPRAAVAAHRTFRPGGGLYCEYEVFGAARDPAGGAPRVSAGLAVRTAAGETARQAAPTPIAADRDGRLVRLVGLDLAGLPGGAYEIVLDVHDDVGGATVERREPFTIAP